MPSIEDTKGLIEIAYTFGYLCGTLDDTPLTEEEIAIEFLDILESMEFKREAEEFERNLITINNIDNTTFDIIDETYSKIMNEWLGDNNE